MFIRGKTYSKKFILLWTIESKNEEFDFLMDGASTFEPKKPNAPNFL